MKQLLIILSLSSLVGCEAKRTEPKLLCDVSTGEAFMAENVVGSHSSMYVTRLKEADQLCQKN